MFEADDGHGYSPPRRSESYRWFSRWLKGTEDQEPKGGRQPRLPGGCPLIEGTVGWSRHPDVGHVCATRGTETTPSPFKGGIEGIFIRARELKQNHEIKVSY